MANSGLFLCYARNKELAGPDQGSVDGLGLCLACELVTGPGTVVGAERNRGLWLIYLKSQSAKDALIIEGISYQQRMVTIHARDPFASRGPSTKITISGLRINSSDSEILDYVDCSCIIIISLCNLIIDRVLYLSNCRHVIRLHTS